MFGKRALADEALERLPKQARLQADVMDLFLSGEVSGRRVARVLHNANLAGAAGTKQFGKKPTLRNSARDLLRNRLRASGWPKPYVSSVRGYNPRTEQEEQYQLAFFLPHEIVAAVLRFNDAESVLKAQSLDRRPDLATLRAAFCHQHSLPDALLLGFWADGVPFNNDRSQCLQVLIMSLPGITAAEDFRVPIVGFPKYFQLKWSTWQSLLLPVVWSLRALLHNTHPACRHDGSAWTAQDSARKTLSGSPIGLHAFLAEMRADWSMYKELLQLPGWQGNGPICWRCHATLADLEDVGPDASWRQSPNPKRPTPFPKLHASCGRPYGEL